MIILSYLTSFLIGYLLVDLLCKEENRVSMLMKIILGLGLGLGISGHGVFYSFLLIDRLSPAFVKAAHLLMLCTLIIGVVIRFKGRPRLIPTVRKPDWPAIGLWAIGCLAAFFIVRRFADFYPYGGWDAWQVWNFKARFLFLAGENWKNVFDPELWRSSPHYPLLLPLINIWAFMASPQSLDLAPRITAILFTLMTAGLLSAGLVSTTRNPFAAVAGLLLLTMPFFNLMATNQYCDIVLSFYLLAGLMVYQVSQSHSGKLLSGLYTGLLGFTKPEGLVAALLICGLVVVLEGLSAIRSRKWALGPLGYFTLGVVIASLPTFAFHALYSPGNQTFVNGLFSTDKPADLQRFLTIAVFWAFEFVGPKWNGLWMLVLAGIILGGKKLWQKDNILTALFLTSYLSVILCYYQLNTYFEIKWWLSVSLNRILLSLLPIALYWVFSNNSAKDR